MELRHYINGTLVEEPAGWGEFTEDIKRNYKARMIGNEYPIDVTFTGGAYAELSSLYDSDPCGIVSYVVKQECGDGIYIDAVKCSIVLADIEFNLDRCTAQVKATDDGIGARIANNAKVIVYPKAEQTKTNEPLTPAASFELLVFDPPGNSYSAFPRVAYDWKEAMRHCVSYITDLNVTIASDWYDALPDTERWCVIDGEELRTHDDVNSQAKYTFDSLFNELGKKYNLWAGVERDADGAPIIRIEPEGYFYGDWSGITFDSTRDLIRKVDQDRLFASVKVGSKTYEKDTQGNFALPFLILRGFTEETFNLKCQCNTDAELDLLNDWIIDSNIIEDVLVNGVDDHDEKMFLIQYTESTGEATAIDFASTGYLYNEQAQNYKVLNRWFFNCDLGVDTEDPGDQLFYASLTNGPQQAYSHSGIGSSAAVVAQTRFNDDFSGGGFDPANNYGNGTTQGNPVATVDSRYTASVQGFYYFLTTANFHLTKTLGYSNFGVKATIYMLRYNSSNVLIDTSSSATVDMLQTGNYSLATSFGFSMDPGDYVVAMSRTEQLGGNIINVGAVDCDITSGSFFLEATTLGGGGVVQTDPSDFYGTVYTFERHCTLDQWKQLVADGSLSVKAGTRSTLYEGYPKNCSRNLKTGATTWEIIATRN